MSYGVYSHTDKEYDYRSQFIMRAGRAGGLHFILVQVRSMALLVLSNATSMVNFCNMQFIFVPLKSYIIVCNLFL